MYTRFEVTIICSGNTEIRIPSLVSLCLIIAEFCAFTQTSRQVERHASEPNQEHTNKRYIVPYTKSVYPFFTSHNGRRV